jgi:hypothetical protein
MQPHQHDVEMQLEIDKKAAIERNKTLIELREMIEQGRFPSRQDVSTWLVPASC